MTYVSPFDKAPAPLARFVSLVAATAVTLALGCATTSQTSSESAPAPEEEGAAQPIDETVPDVNRCHTDTQVCELPEPLQPGLGCFCPLADGTSEAGSAGG